MASRIQTLATFANKEACVSLDHSRAMGDYELYPTTERHNYFSVSDVTVRLSEPLDELRHLWRGRQALCISGVDDKASDELDSDLQAMLDRCIRGVLAQSAAEGYTYGNTERDILRMSTHGCGHLVGLAGDLRWVVAMTEHTQVWDGRTGRRSSLQAAARALEASVPARLIISLCGIAVPFNDGPYCDFEVNAIELLEGLSTSSPQRGAGGSLGAASQVEAAPDPPAPTNEEDEKAAPPPPPPTQPGGGSAQPPPPPPAQPLSEPVDVTLETLLRKQTELATRITTLVNKRSDR